MLYVERDGGIDEPNDRTDPRPARVMIIPVAFLFYASRSRIRNAPEGESSASALDVHYLPTPPLKASDPGSTVPSGY